MRLIDSHCHLNYEGLAERQEDVVPVHLRHHEIQDDHVGVLAARRLDPRPSPVGRERLVALLEEGVAEHRPDHVFVIDHEHACHADHLIPPSHRHASGPGRVGRRGVPRTRSARSP